MGRQSGCPRSADLLEHLSAARCRRTPIAANIWFPVECDIPMVGSWFWNENPPKSLAQLLDIYYVSVGRNSILLLNVAPNKQGLFSDESVKRLREFRICY